MDQQDINNQQTITLVDDQGNKVDLDLINVFEYEGQNYLLVAEQDSDEALLMVETEQGYRICDDEELFERVSAYIEEQGLLNG